MPEQLGKIEKLEVEHFKQGKKLYLVPLIYCGENAPDEYKEKCNRYWQQVAEQLVSLSSKIGTVNRVYHESVSESGENGMAAVEKLNAASYRIARTHCDNGASFEAIEERDLLEEVMDWQRCLMIGFMSDSVASKISGFYFEAAKKRNQLMAGRISETLKEDEAGLLFIREEHSVQFPGDVEVFSIFPQALDEIHRWYRDQAVLAQHRPAEGSEGKDEGKGEDIKKKTRKKAKRESKSS
jgi:hypothetical protein